MQTLRLVFLAALLLLLPLLLLVTATTTTTATAIVTAPQQQPRQNCTVYTGRCQSDWMARLPIRVRQGRPLKDIMVLGTHDSGAHPPLNFELTPPCQSHKIFNVFRDLCLDPLTRPLVLPVVDNITIAQPNLISAQLEQGIRAFDLRITYTNISGVDNFYLSHSFIGSETLEGSLRAMADFLDAHRGEVLFVNAEYDYEHRTATGVHSQRILKFVDKILGKQLNPQCHDIDALRLSSLVASGRRVLFSFAESYDTASFPNVCGGSLQHTFWPNGANASASMTRIDDYMDTENFQANQRVLELVFFTVTPDTASILEDVLQSLFSKNHTVVGLEEWSANIRPMAENRIEKFVVPQKRSGLSIVSVDWPTDAYVEKVIQWNLETYIR